MCVKKFTSFCQVSKEDAHKRKFFFLLRVVDAHTVVLLGKQGTKMRRYSWHSASGWPIPMLIYAYIFSNKIYGSNFVKQHSKTAAV